MTDETQLLDRAAGLVERLQADADVLGLPLAVRGQLRPLGQLVALASHAGGRAHGDGGLVVSTSEVLRRAHGVHRALVAVQIRPSTGRTAKSVCAAGRWICHAVMVTALEQVRTSVQAVDAAEGLIADAHAHAGRQQREKETA